MNQNTTHKPTSEMIILAGGLGTRLQSVVNNLPKCMAPVNNKPFLFYVIKYFAQQGILNFIFSLGYKHEIIVDYLNRLQTQNGYFSIKCSIEEEPLGTGGAIKKACALTNTENVFITNGDTLFKANTLIMKNFHYIKNADCTLTLKPMKNFNRYGVIQLNEDDSIKSFAEKKYYEQGLINGGLYMLNVKKFESEPLPEKFSFETDYLEKFHSERKMFGLVQDEYFIDIGIPQDYERAKQELVIGN
jgi:D-glycero-alpha-D-manno-heptose 1-phosphate guanylyltransferase